MKSLNEFKKLLQDVLPANQPVLLAQVTPLLRMKDESFSPADYGEEKLLHLLKKCPDIISVKEEDGAFPPVHSCTLTSNSQANIVADRIVQDTSMGYESLFRRYHAQPKSSAFAFFPYREELGESWDEPFRKLANLAVKENWSSSSSPKENLDVLRNYLNFTFLRLQEEKKIVYERTNACFNTGLQTQLGVDIIALFNRNQREASEDWYSVGFFEWGNPILHGLNKPFVAQYIQNPSDVVFDWNYELVLNVPHIVEQNKERLPAGIQDNPLLAKRLIDGSIKDLVERIKRNYKLAVPHWHRGRIQLLLPLFLTNHVNADLALVAEKDEEHRVYNVRTALTPEMAYNDARLICKPDTTWMHP